MGKYYLKKDNFLLWYFGDKPDHYCPNGYTADDILHNGKENVNAYGLFDSCSFIPQWLCEDQPISINNDLDRRDVELI